MDKKNIGEQATFLSEHDSNELMLLPDFFDTELLNQFKNSKK